MTANTFAFLMTQTVTTMKEILILKHYLANSHQANGNGMHFFAITPQFVLGQFVLRQFVLEKFVLRQFVLRDSLS